MFLNNRIKYFIAILTILFLFSTEAIAQIKITGTIRDGQTQQLLAYASVIVPNTTIGSSTNEKGKFELVVEEGTPVIEISMIGYKTYYYIFKLNCSVS